MPASQAQLDELQAVNVAINTIPFVSDNPIFDEPPDTWKFRPDDKGFLCRDYAEGKAAALIDKGWPQLSLSIALCWTEPVPGAPDGEYHAVLWAETDGPETWVLDNRSPSIYRWDRPPYPYRWNWRQIAGTDGFLSIA